MAGKVSRAVIDSLKRKIDVKLGELRAQLPADLDVKASAGALKELGLEGLAKEVKAALKGILEAIGD